MISVFTQGMGLGGSLIVAIGAQNAFVLSQGVRKSHHLLIALVCSLCDAILIALGVTGVGSAVAANPVAGAWAALAGTVFLYWYGLGAFRSALKGEVLVTEEQTETSRRAALVTTLAVTLLNPHVYLDTVVLMGSVSGQYAGSLRYIFGAGAMTASFLWFFSLSLFGKFLAPCFASQKAWRMLDGIVCLTMWGIGTKLLFVWWNGI